MEPWPGNREEKIKINFTLEKLSWLDQYADVTTRYRPPSYTHTTVTALWNVNQNCT